jgi:asparagine synthase (glutamine-hydrolysing)
MLARDPFGVKPLYYVEVDGELVFASEIKALLAHPRVRACVNRKGLQQYLTFQFCLHGQTLFQGIHALEPGFYLEGEQGAIARTVRYWDTNYHIDDEHTEEYFSDRLSELLWDSARLQIRSDVPVGAYLSGGTDSSLVASMASRHVGANRLPVFHGRFAEGPAYDESRYAKALCESIGGEYHELVPTAEQFVEVLPRLIYALDEPAAGPGLFPQYMVSRAAAKHVKVILGGQGGDEIFGGYARYLIGYLEQAIKGAILETQDEGKHIVTLASIIPNLPLLRQYQPLMQHFWKDGLFGEMDARYFRLIYRGPEGGSMLTRDALQQFDQEEVFADFQGVFNHPQTQSYVNKMTHFDQKTLLPALLQVEDRVSMAASLESRVPLLDTRIVDLVTTMPPAIKFRGGDTKYIFKRAMKDVLPASVLGRKDKMGFPVPLREWLVAGPVRDFVHDVLFSRACVDRGLFDRSQLDRLIAGDSGFARELWGALCLELWHQRFIDKP